MKRISTWQVTNVSPENTGVPAGLPEKVHQQSSVQYTPTARGLLRALAESFFHNSWRDGYYPHLSDEEKTQKDLVDAQHNGCYLPPHRPHFFSFPSICSHHLGYRWL